jgi:hypothetical protein
MVMNNPTPMWQSTILLEDYREVEALQTADVSPDTFPL